MLRRLPLSAARIGGQTFPRRLAQLCWALVVGLLVSACVSPPTAPPPSGLLRPPSAAAAAVAPGVTAVPGLIPFPIEQNVGQAGPGVGYLLRAGALQVGFGTGELTYVLTDRAGAEGPSWQSRNSESSIAEAEARVWTVRQELVGATGAIPSGTVGSPTTVSYFKGRPEQWLVGVPAFQQVAYADAWPGITVTYEQEAGGPKSAYQVAPGADARQIRLLYRGARVHLNEAGGLVAETPLGELRESPPQAWQEHDGSRVAVEAHFDLLDASLGDEAEYGFALGAYDPGLPLVIDPQIAYASYIGGSGADQGRSIAVDESGNVYVTGHIDPAGAIFPGGPATFDATINGDVDAFVAKVNPAGTGLLYASFIGGSGADFAFGIAVDAAGSAYITGLTSSTEATFPTGSGMGTLQSFGRTYHGGSGDAFVAKVSPDGRALVYAGYIGGSGFDQSQWIAIDAAGNAYVAGYTESSEATFPSGTGLGSLPTVDGTYNGAGDAFVAKVNAAGTALLYAGYIGGSGYEHAYGIAVDSAGAAYITGEIQSSEATFPNGTGMASLPTLATINGTYSGGSDAFVVKVNPAGTALLYATYIGSSAFDRGYAVVVDAASNAYVTGRADAPLAPPLLNNGSGGTVTTFNGTHNPYGNAATAADAFLVKVNAAGTGLVYAGYIGGNDLEAGVALAVGGDGSAYVLGYTASSEATFPTGSGIGTLPTFDSTYNGGGDTFLAKVNPAGSALVYAGYLGGNGVDTNPPWSTETGIGVAVDQAGNAYLTGRTNSSQATFPDGLGMSGLPTFDNTYGGGITDAFVVKVTSTATCALAARQASTGLTYANAAYQNAYYDYVTYGNTNGYYAYAYEYQAYLNSQAGYNALKSGNYATAKTNFNSAAAYAYYGYQYAYASYTATNSTYAYNAFTYGYYTLSYENQAYASC